MLPFSWGLAQNKAFNPTPVKQFDRASLASPVLGIETTSITLLPDAFSLPCASAVSLFSSSGGEGYVFGPNGFGDREKAQWLHFVGDNARITDVVGYFAGKNLVDDAEIKTYIYDVNTADNSPGNRLATSEVIMASNIDTTDLNIFNFATPVDITADTSFFASFDFSDVYATSGADTTELGMISTENGCSTGEFAWERWSDDSWHSIFSAWGGLDVALMVGLVIEFDEVAAIEDAFFQQKGLTVYPAYPNPAPNHINLNFALDNPRAVTVSLYSIEGKQLMALPLGTLSAGEHVQPLDISSLPSGTYLYGIQTAESSVMSRFTK